uniref:Uncharacterized protein n=1 Tax=Ananas comosus var. bracteatus TaxID=296719 RepID=A0A6V7QLQ6_ANACO|nr:unnamed protein product [Ananas comosus var. bracteatus]
MAAAAGTTTTTTTTRSSRCDDGRGSRARGARHWRSTATPCARRASSRSPKRAACRGAMCSVPTCAASSRRHALSRTPKSSPNSSSAAATPSRRPSTGSSSPARRWGDAEARDQSEGGT